MVVAAMKLYPDLVITKIFFKSLSLYTKFIYLVSDWTKAHHVLIHKTSCSLLCQLVGSSSYVIAKPAAIWSCYAKLKSYHYSFL